MEPSKRPFSDTQVEPSAGSCNPRDMQRPCLGSNDDDDPDVLAASHGPEEDNGAGDDGRLAGGVLPAALPALRLLPDLRRLRLGRLASGSVSAPAASSALGELPLHAFDLACLAGGVLQAAPALGLLSRLGASLSGSYGSSMAGSGPAASHSSSPRGELPQPLDAWDREVGRTEEKRHRDAAKRRTHEAKCTLELQAKEVKADKTALKLFAAQAAAKHNHRVSTTPPFWGLGAGGCETPLSLQITAKLGRGVMWAACALGLVVVGGLGAMLHAAMCARGVPPAQE